MRTLAGRQSGIVQTGIACAATSEFGSGPFCRHDHTAIACVPVFVGMLAGQWIRGRVNEETFRKVLLIAMVLIGLNMVRQALF